MRPVLMLLVALLLSSCEAQFDWPWLKKAPEERPGAASGETVSEDRPVAAFDAVRLEGLGRLVFDPSIPAGVVRVTAQRSQLPRISTTVQGATLLLKEEGFHGPSAFELTFRVAPPDRLTQISLAGVGTVEAVTPLQATNLTLALDGLGKIDVAVDAQTVSARQKGQGELAAKGTADRVSVQADGLGKVNLVGLVAKDVEVESNGLGEVTVYASQKLKVRANGLGAVHFAGHPPVTDVQTKGLTQVTASD